MTTDLTFITNEDGKDLATRFSELIKDTSHFDVLVGYFYASGFYALYKSLENVEKIRVLIGIGTGEETYGLIEESRRDPQQRLFLSHKETKDRFSEQIVKEMEESPDSVKVEEGVRKVVEWLRSGKLEIKVYPEDPIHAKLYIMTFKKGDRDTGRVITGSSNFTRSGLKDNIEFNVELKDNSDYEFSLRKFNELWARGVDVSEEYVQTIKERTWLNDGITPYELYLKFLYEYLKEKINLDKEEMYIKYLPDNFMDLKYQRDAVSDAKGKLDSYGGVFLSDVVGLGKTYVAAMLAQQLDGRTLVIAPPALLDEDNPGSWRNVFLSFGIPAGFSSLGKLDKVIKQGTERYTNIIIDEAHRFRTEDTQRYEKLYQICRGKRVILVSATPLNNTPKDILAQIKLFQNAYKSTLPNPEVRDLEKYFKELEKRLRGLDRQKDRDEYLRIVRENAEDIRKNVLCHLMVRRTRNAIVKYYGKDLKKQGLKFPEVQDPEPVVYEFDEELDRIFNRTLELIIRKFRYARYTPLLYLKEGISPKEATSQKNMGRFMKILLVKRLESSFFAFKMSIDRFIRSYEQFIYAYEKGEVFISKKHMNRIFEFLEDDDEEGIQRLIDEEKAWKLPGDDFEPKFMEDLKYDLKLLREIQKLWSGVERDPKLDKFIERLKKDTTLKKNKLIVFTESKETAEYLGDRLSGIPGLKGGIMVFSSKSGEAERRRIIDNFDANVRKELQRDDVRILITTDILSEGVSLHRSNVVINYDIPWNPVRMMQRVGRINRVAKDLPFSKIYTYNFFPAGPINENISLKEAAEAKIKAFIEMLGNDARLLTDEEIKSHELFTKLGSKRLLTGEDEEEDPELKYLALMREIRDKNPELFETIKRLPKKARTAKKYNSEREDAVITFFRKGKLKKIFIAREKGVKELDFDTAAHIMEANKRTKREKLKENFYEYMEKNKEAFDSLLSPEREEPPKRSGASLESKLMKKIKAIIREPAFTDDDEYYLMRVLELLEDGAMPKPTMKKISKETKGMTDPHKILAAIRRNTPSALFRETFAETSADISGPREVILSEYLIERE